MQAPAAARLATLTWAAAGALSGVCCPAAADTGWSLLADHSRGQYLSVEKLPGTRFELNRDEGLLRTHRLALQGRQGPAALTLELSRGSGTVAYRGTTQLGQPLSTHSEVTLDHAALRADGRVAVWPGVAVIPGAGITAACFERDIQPTAISGRLTETLCSRRAELHLAADWTPADWPGWSIGLEWQWARPWSQRLRGDSHGVYDTFELQPAHRNQTTGRAELRYRSAGLWGLGLAWQQQVTRYGASAAQPLTLQGRIVGAASYPGATQTLRGWSLQFEITPAAPP